jgi:hypothetical protein
MKIYTNYSLTVSGTILEKGKIFIIDEPRLLLSIKELV